MEQPTKLFNRNFLFISLATFLMFFAFNLVMPVVAMYVMDRFQASAATAGVVVSAYIITALIMRPLSGFLVDKYDRKRLYITTYIIFTLLFFGYILSTSIPQLIITRVLLGATFAVITTACNTIAIDIMPAQRRNEGIGYFGAIIVISMAIGPMVGLYLMDIMSYQGLFIVGIISCSLGVIVSTFIKTQHREPVQHARLSLDRFFLVEATVYAVIMALIYFLYGSLMAFVSIYTKECGLDINSGNFFLIFSVGIIIARVLAGRLLAKGLTKMMVYGGIISIIVAGVLFTIHLSEVTFPISSLMMGFGFGLVCPPMQATVVGLVSHDRRGTANSTYFIALDTGSGLGMLTGGAIAQMGDGFHTTYLVGVSFVTLALVIYWVHNRLRETERD